MIVRTDGAAVNGAFARRRVTWSEKRNRSRHGERIEVWTLQFPKEGDDHFDCEWIKVRAQAVPAHVGSPTPGMGYEAGDPYAAFLPPAVEPIEPVASRQQCLETRLLEVVVAGQRLSHTFIRHHNEGNAVSERPVFVWPAGVQIEAASRSAR